jgi:hypothetical protein
MSASYTVTVSKTERGFAALIATAAGEPWCACEEQPSVDAMVLKALRVLGESDPEAEAEVVGVENGALCA